MIFFQTFAQWAENAGWELSTIVRTYGVFNFVEIVGLLTGWIIIKFWNVKSVIFFSIAQILGIFLLIFVENSFGKITGAGLWGLGIGIIYILVPSIFAGGRAGIKTFASLYLIILLYQIIQRYTFSISRISVIEYSILNISPIYYSLILSIPILIGIIFLIPVKSILFDEEPKVLIQPLEPKERNAFIVFLLNILPFFYIYYMYRIHGELATFTKSNKLLSKRSALWISLLFPITMPIITTTFYDVFEEISFEKNLRINKKWIVMILTLLFYPIAGALIQSDLNKLIINKSLS